MSGPFPDIPATQTAWALEEVIHLFSDEPLFLIEFLETWYHFRS